MSDSSGRADLAGSAFKRLSQKRLSELNARIAGLARRQGGHVTRSQLLQLGLDAPAVQSRQRRGLLIRVHYGVYAVGHLSTNPIDRAHGALLAAGPLSAVAGRSAATLWGMNDSWPHRLELISPLQRRIPGLHIRRCSKLQRHDIRVHRGIRVTSPARTMLDIAQRASSRALDRFHNELRMRNLIKNDDLVDVARRNPRHPGATILIELAGASAGEAKRSMLEVDWPRFASRYGLPEYELNVHVAGTRVDVLFTPDRLVVELDGWATHGTRHAYENDRLQDAQILATSGIPTLRITRDAFKSDPAAQAERVRAVLARR